MPEQLLPELFYRMSWKNSGVPNSHISLDSAIELLSLMGTDAQQAESLLESVQQRDSSAKYAYLAAAMLFRMNPDRVEFFTVLTNGVSSSANYLPTWSLVALPLIGTNAQAVVPLLKILAIGEMRKSDQHKLVIATLQSISKEAAVESLETRMRLSMADNDPEHWYWDAGELIRTAPDRNRETALATLEQHYDSIASSPGWNLWRMFMIKSLKPDQFEEQPPLSVALFLKKIADHDTDAEVRRTAQQALKYFKLRWGLEPMQKRGPFEHVLEALPSRQRHLVAPDK